MAAGVWWHVTNDTWLLGSSFSQWRLLAYIAPAFVGTTLLFFMIKPVLARLARGVDPIPAGVLAGGDVKAFSAEELLATGGTIRGADFGLADSTFESATSMQAEAQEQQRRIAPPLDTFENAAARRLACGLIAAARQSSSDAILSTRIGKTLDRVGRELAVPCPPAITSQAISVAACCGIRPDEDGGIDLSVFERAPSVYLELLGRIVTIVRSVEGSNAVVAEA